MADSTISALSAVSSIAATDELVVSQGGASAKRATVAQLMTGALSGSSYTLAATGATARTLQAKLTEEIYVEDFGAVGDGTTNDGTAINAAIAHANGLATSTAGGAVIKFGAKTYKSTASLTALANFVTLQGQGTQATRLLFSGLSTDWVTIGNLSTATRDQCIRDMLITGDGTNTASEASGVVTGAAIKVLNSFEPMIERVRVEYALCALDVGAATNLVRVNDCYLMVNQASALYGINWHAAGTGAERADNLWLTGTVVDGSWSGASTIGINWRGFAHTLSMTGGAVLKCAKLLYVQNPANSSAYYPSFGTFTGVAFEGAKTRSIEITAGGNIRFDGCDISNSTGAASQGGADDICVKITADASYSVTRAISFTDCLIGLCRQEGISADCRDLRLIGTQLYSTSAVGSASYSAISLGANVVKAQILGTVAEMYGGLARAAYGVTVNAAAQAVVIDGLDATACVTGAVNDATSGYVSAMNTWGPGGAVVGLWASPVYRWAEVRHSYSAGAVSQRVYNTGTGASAVASLVAVTGTANSFVQFALLDNAGSPQANISGGAALTRFDIKAPIIALQNASGATFMPFGSALTAAANDAAAAAGSIPLYGYYWNTTTGAVAQRRV